MKPKKIRILVKEPFAEPEERTVTDKLETYQKIVEGYIETVRIASDLLLVCNECGKLDGLTPNFAFCGDSIVGTVFFVSYDDDGNFVSLTDKQINSINFLMEWNGK